MDLPLYKNHTIADQYMDQWIDAGEKNKSTNMHAHTHTNTHFHTLTRIDTHTITDMDTFTHSKHQPYKHG